MDRSVTPGDDFFDYANGTWLKNNPIPADKSRYGMFNVLDDLSKTRTKAIIDAQSKDSSSRIRTPTLPSWTRPRSRRRA